MSFKAVIFDLDGTLADTLADLADATNFVLAEMGLPTHPVDAYRYFVGEGARTLITRALGEGREGLADDALPRMRARYAGHMYDKTRLYDGVPEMLDALAARGLSLAVLSNKPHDATADMGRRLLARWPFAVIRGVGPDGVHKPDPRHALAIAETLGVAPADCLYLGDTWIDMKTASAAGMFGVGVLWGFRDEAELRDAGARAVISRPDQLLRMLD
ncbi:MAG: Phosphoglycolate phosphatase [Phycisphaerae bacterium]|nr:Phosphoglycolate phosphatase [Phycisphaerae bacterium]